MTKRQRLPGINLRIEECTQCGASSGLSETLGESYAHETDSGSPHLWVIFVPVPVSVSVSAFPCFPVALKGPKATCDSKTTAAEPEL